MPISPSLVRCLRVGSLAAVTLLVGCGPPTPTAAEPRSSGGGSTASAQTSGTTASRGSVAARRAALLNRIRSADPDKETIERAMINEQNELGLVMSRKTNLDDVPQLLKAMLAQMAEDFPDQDLTVVAYAPTEPPRTIGTGRLDAQTREMTYRPASVR